ncbi:hypothetical protein NQ318_008542 [Aromia moschata]|uniref:Uncharacterized protein n=1 Tax=Aromia moschata TaxID=1265417 RepID=A0AAV8YY21_9CUCU|nr:hypothetical protein NQ318_008542 [Aromia moschata]
MGVDQELAQKAGIITDEQKTKLMEYNKQCMEETNVANELILKAKAGEYSDDPLLKKQILCVNKKAGFQNDAGDLQIDFIKSKVNDIIKDEKTTADIVGQCAVNKGTPEDTAFEAVKCFHKFSPEKRCV